MKKITLFTLLIILIFGFIVRLYKFSNPLADWHSWRQTVTSSVSRTFVNEGFDLLRPRYQDVSNVPSGKNNPHGYFFAEFPIYNLLQAGAYKYLGIISLEEWGRLITILASLSSSVFIFLIVRKFQSDLAGLLAAVFYTFIPFNIYFGRVVLPDPLTVAASLGGIYFFTLWINEETKRGKYYFFLLLSALLSSAAFLLKPFALFFSLPMVYLAFRKYGLEVFRKWELYFYSVVCLFPFILWRIWMLNFPEGIPLSKWLFNDGEIRFKGAYFFWIFGERIGKLILGYWGVGLIVLGLLARVKKEKYFFYAFLASSLVYLGVIAKGNVQHDYYQILIMPTICIFLGIGGEYLLSAKDFINKYAGSVLFLFLFALSLVLGWYYVRDYFNINNPKILIAAEAVDKTVPQNAKVLANLGGDTTFLYYTKRKGWASYQDDLPEMLKLGADYLVVVDPKPSDFAWAQNSKIITQTSDYAIIDLHMKQ